MSTTSTPATEGLGELERQVNELAEIVAAQVIGYELEWALVDGATDRHWTVRVDRPLWRGRQPVAGRG